MSTVSVRQLINQDGDCIRLASPNHHRIGNTANCHWVVTVCVLYTESSRAVWCNHQNAKFPIRKARKMTPYL